MSYFREVLTDFDEERVYPSDVKKILIGTIHCKLKGLVVTEETITEVQKKPAADKPKREKS
jgi:hypothetical protein